MKLKNIHSEFEIGQLSDFKSAIQNFAKEISGNQ